MSGRFYVAAVFILMTIAVHLAYILFTPGSKLADATADISARNGVNSFAILDAATANELVKHPSSDMVVAVCVFDLSSGPVRIFGSVAGHYWVMSVYSQRGDVIYTLNDRQAASETIEVTITRQQADNPDAPRDLTASTLGVTAAQVVSPDPQGLVVIRSGLSLPNQETSISEVLTRSTCQA